MRSEFRADVDRRRSVAGANNGNRNGIQLIEPNGQGKQQSKKNAELSGSAEQDEARKPFGQSAGIIKKREKAVFSHPPRQWNIYENRAKTNRHEKQRLI